MRVVTWRGRRWRAEEHRDGWKLYQLGFLRLDKASLDQVTRMLLAEGVDPVVDVDPE